MPGIGPLLLPSSPQPQSNPGRQLMDGDDFNKVSGNMFSAESGKIATAGGGRPNAYPIKASNTQFSVCATNDDSCVLPVAWPGLRCSILNDGAASLKVFGNGSDTIQGTAGAFV